MAPFAKTDVTPALVAGALHRPYLAALMPLRPRLARHVAAALVLVAASAASQTRAQWTLDAVVARALEESPDVQRARAQVAIADAHRAHGEQPWMANPVLGARAMVGVPDDRAATYAVYVGLPFDLSGRQGLWSREAEGLVEASDAWLEAARNDARRAAGEAYVDVAAADARRALQSGRVRLAEELLARTRTLVDAGSATAVDLALVEAELGEARAASHDAERSATEARALLRALLDLAADEPLEVVALGPPEAPEGSLARWQARAREGRAEPRAFAAAQRRLRVTEDRLYAEAIDPLMLGLEWESQGNTQTAHTLGVSMSTTLPLLRTAQGERAVTRSEEEMAVVEEGLATRAVERDVVRAAQRLEASLAELRALEELALPAVERAREGTLTLLESGATDLFRVLGTQRQLVELRERRVAVLREAWRARVELERAIGGEP